MTDMERILLAITSQRWFFFENNEKILFDRCTALIWANLNLFPWKKCYIKSTLPLFFSDQYEEVKNLISEKNSQKWGGFSDWEIPMLNEVFIIVRDKYFPLQKDNIWLTKDEDNDLQVHEFKYDKKDDSMILNNKSYVTVDVLPCSSALVPKYFYGTPQETFDIFKANELIPIFDNKEINELYKKIFTKPPQDKKSSSSFDFQSILEKFDAEAVDKSAIRYYEAVLSIVNELLATLPENDTSEAMTAKKRKLLFIKDQAEAFFNRLDEINTGYYSIRELAKLEAEPRPSFAFLVESLTRIINEQ